MRRALYATILSILFLLPARADTFKLRIIAFNDFHGNLQSPGKFRASAQSPNVAVGGIDFLAGYVEHLKSENPNNVVVSAGDLAGASPLVSALFHDEDTIEAMNLLGLEINAVGNHEFDKGKQELLRLQNGGCSTQDQNTCQGAAAGTPVPFEGAKFQYLAANVVDTASGKTILPGYAIKSYNGVKIAFIGLTLKDTPSLVVPSGVAGLKFMDEAASINAIVRQLRPQGIESFVILIHQGGAQTTKGSPDINACEGGLSGTPIEPIVSKLDDAVDLVISAHTHQPYICQLPNSAGRRIPVTSASAFGRVITDIDVTIDTQTKNVTAVAARNILVDRTNTDGIAPDAAIKNLVDKYAVLAAPIANRPVGSVAADILKTRGDNGESPMGDVIADAELEATRAASAGGAVVAFMNSGGVRADLPFASPSAGTENGKVTYSELFTAQPFGNNLETMTLTGAQIKTLLEEQFRGCAESLATDNSTPSDDRFLQVSAGFTYTWTESGPACNKVDPAGIKLNNAPVSPSAKYRVTLNNFLADGDQYPVLKNGTDRVGGPQDIDALVAYFASHPAIAPPPQTRITLKP